MISPIFGRSGTDNATLERFSPLANYFVTPTGTENINRNVMDDSGTLSNFYVKRTTAPGAGTSVAYTIVKNGVNTSCVATVTDTGTTGSDATNSVSYAAGDVISVSIKPTGTVATSAASWQIENNSTGQGLLTGETTSIAAGTDYISLMNGTFQASATDAQQIFPTGGVVDRAYYDLSVTTGAAKTWTATFVKNGVDTTLVVAITNGTAGNDTTHTVSVVAGDTGYWRVDATNTPASTRMRIGARFTPTIDGESMQAATSTANLVNSGNNFSGVQGGANAYSTTEANRANWLGSAFDIKKLYASVDTANAVASWTFTARSNSADTTLTCAITGVGVTTNNDTTHTVTPTTGALLGMNIVGATAPTACPAQWSFVTYRAPVTVATKLLAVLGVG